MNKDFAKQSARHRSAASGRASARRRKTGASKSDAGFAPPWLWLGGGVALGMLVSFLLQLVSMPLGGMAAGPQPTLNPTAAARPAEPARTAEEFTFFQVLQENEVIIEDPPAEEPATEVNDASIYYLQAGSFPTDAAAEARRAEIAFMGQETAIERAEVNGQVRYRVMIGPIDSRERQRAIRNRLSGQGIETLAYKRDRT